jgi:hypothetical protein
MLASIARDCALITPSRTPFAAAPPTAAVNGRYVVYLAPSATIDIHFAKNVSRCVHPASTVSIRSLSRKVRRHSPSAGAR